MQEDLQRRAALGPGLGERGVQRCCSRRSFIKISAVAAAAMAVSGTGILAGCSNSQEDEVWVESVLSLCGLGYLGSGNRFAGIVTARGTKEIMLQEGFRVDEVLVEVGQEVTAGQVLFRYNSEQADLALRRAKLELEQLESSLESKQSQRDQLERDKASAGADAQLDYQLEIQSLDADMVELEYNIASKKDEVSRCQESVDNLEVESPLDGVVQSIDTAAVNGTSSMMDTGEVQPFMVLVETGTYQVKGYINEANVGEIAEGSGVVITSRVDGTTWTGAVERIDWDNPQQGSQDAYYGTASTDDTTTSSKYPFYVDLDSSDGLLLGQHVYIELDAGRTAEGGLWLPEYYIMDADASPWVWAADGSDKLEKRDITVGDYNPDLGSYLIESGLGAEDYVAFPEDRLTEGMSCSRVELEA